MNLLDIILSQTDLEQSRSRLAYDYACSIPFEDLREHLKVIEAKKATYLQIKQWDKEQWQEYELLCYIVLEILAQLNNKERRKQQNEKNR